MKRISIVLLLFCFTISISAQSVLSFGVRGGLEFLMPHSSQSTSAKLGVGGDFDVGYTYYWPTRHGDWGIHSGVSIGYTSNECQINLLQQYTNFDYLNNEMLYTIKGDVNVSLKRAYAEVPLMVAVRAKGFVATWGVKAQYSFWSRAVQRIENVSIDAFYVPYDVHVTDELITGALSEDDMRDKNVGGAMPTLNILAAARVGYEARVGNNSRIGVVVFVDYSVWNNLSSQRINQPLIAVAPISDPTYPVPPVIVNSAFSTVISGINPLQVGVSLYYGIEFEQRHYGKNRRIKTSRYNHY